MEPIFSDEYLHKIREAYALANVAAKQFHDACNAIQIGYSNPIFSDERIQHLHEVLEEIECRWNQYVEHFTQAGGNWDKMRELIVYTSRSNPPNLYARETAKRCKYNPQKLRKTDLYLRAKLPIIIRS